MATMLVESGVGEGVLARMARALGPGGEGKCRRYFDSGVRLRYERRRLEVAASSGFLVDLIGRRFGEELRRAVREETGDMDAAVVFRVDPGMVDAGATLAAERNAQAVAAAARTGVSPERTPEAPGVGVGVAGMEATGPARLSYSAPGGAWARPSGRHGPSVPRDRAGARGASAWRSLDDFVVGASNRLAHSAAVRMAEAEGPAPFSPLFLHGVCGVGKTHLLQGIMERFRERHPGARARYTTGEEFTNAFVTAVQAGQMEGFRKSFRGVDLLCIDDVHYLASKTQTQQELLHTFNAIAGGGARVALVSDAHPRQLTRLNDGLVSRFVAGMVVRIDKPERSTRAEIVRRLCVQRGLAIEPAAAQAVADRCEGAVRDLEGAVTRLEAVHRLLGSFAGAAASGPRSGDHPDAGEGAGPVGMIAVDHALKARGESTPRKPVPVRLIAERCCATLRVDADDLFGRSRHRRVVLARSMAAFLARDLTTQSYPEIARELNRPNHSTIVTAVARVAKQLERDERCEIDAPSGSREPEWTMRGLYEALRDDVLRSAASAG